MPSATRIGSFFGMPGYPDPGAGSVVTGWDVPGSSRPGSTGVGSASSDIEDLLALVAEDSLRAEDDDQRQREAGDDVLHDAEVGAVDEPVRKFVVAGRLLE